MQNRITTFLKKLSLSVLIMTVIFLVCLWGLFVIADYVFKDKNTAFDNNVFAWVKPWVNETNTRIMSFITFFGSHQFLLPANLLLIIFYLFVKEKKKAAFNILTVSLTSVAAMFGIKYLVQRERPILPLGSVQVHGYSFPSGHTFTSLTFFGIIAYIAYRNIKNKVLRFFVIVFLAVFILLIGFSRIYLYHHYATDVIAGLCLGIIWLLLAKLFLVKTQKIILPAES